MNGAEKQETTGHTEGKDENTESWQAQTCQQDVSQQQNCVCDITCILTEFFYHKTEVENSNRDRNCVKYCRITKWYGEETSPIRRQCFILLPDSHRFIAQHCINSTGLWKKKNILFILHVWALFEVSTAITSQASNSHPLSVRHLCPPSLCELNSCTWPLISQEPSLFKRRDSLFPDFNSLYKRFQNICHKTSSPPTSGQPQIQHNRPGLAAGAFLLPWTGEKKQKKQWGCSTLSGTFHYPCQEHKEHNGGKCNITLKGRGDPNIADEQCGISSCESPFTSTWWNLKHQTFKTLLQTQTIPNCWNFLTMCEEVNSLNWNKNPVQIHSQFTGSPRKKEELHIFTTASPWQQSHT